MTARRGVRIRAGSLRGRVVAVPEGARPTEGRVREAFFDIVGPEIAGCRFLDLFAGSGAVGLEAASRGAAAVAQVDVSPVAVRRLEATHRELGLPEIAVHRLELPRQLEALTQRAAGLFDWIYADPPYAFAAYDELLAGLPALLADGGTAVVEHEVRRPPAARVSGLARVDERRYGECALSFYASSLASDSGAGRR